MAIFDVVKGGFVGAVDAVSGVAQTIIEKNRVNAQLNRLRTLMKNECEMINRAYITLGKKYYENKVNGKEEACANEEELFKIIEHSKAQIRKTRERYREIIDSQTVKAVGEVNADELEDITVACSNEDEYGESPFVNDEPAEEAVEEAETVEAVDEMEEAPEAPANDPFNIDITPASDEESDEDAHF